MHTEWKQNWWVLNAIFHHHHIWIGCHWWDMLNLELILCNQGWIQDHLNVQLSKNWQWYPTIRHILHQSYSNSFCCLSIRWIFGKYQLTSFVFLLQPIKIFQVKNVSSLFQYSSVVLISLNKIELLCFQNTFKDRYIDKSFVICEDQKC